MRNSVMLIGRPAQEPTIKTFNDGSKQARFTIVVTEKYNNGNGEWVEETQRFDCVAYNKLAERVERYVRKGNLIALDGRLHTTEWRMPDGETRSKIEIWIYDLFLIDKPTNE